MQLYTILVSIATQAFSLTPSNLIAICTYIEKLSVHKTYYSITSITLLSIFYILPARIISEKRFFSSINQNTFTITINLIESENEKHFHNTQEKIHDSKP